jgi:LPS-assembly protein
VVGITGVALFSITFVCGLTLGSYLLDALGIGPAGRKPPTVRRTIGVILAIAAVTVSVLGRLGVNVNVNRVSDDNYWRDFPRSGLSLTQRLLPASGSLHWAQGDWSMMTLVQQFQTLQDVSSPITPPYDRSPQIVAQYNKWDLNGFDIGFTADTTRFEADYSRIPGGSRTVLRNGQRSFAAAQISHPWRKPWGFVVPKIQLHGTRYQLDTPLANGKLDANR